MAAMRGLVLFTLMSVLGLGGEPSALAQPARAPDAAALTRELVLEPPGAPRSAPLDLDAAMRTLNVPAVAIEIIDIARGGTSIVRPLGAKPQLYQAASLSKLVTAVAALRLVERGRLDLDRDVNDDLNIWHLPASDLTRERKVTLRGLLSMTAGIGVPGYTGYLPGEPLPNLIQILDGKPPANSAAVRAVAVPGTGYAYSGGGYEIVQALIETKTRRRFPDAMRDLVLRPVRMGDSSFAQPLPDLVAKRAERGHRADGSELPDGWRVMPELAAGGLWATSRDMARLLTVIARAWRGESVRVLKPETARMMLSPQNGGPYGLGGAVAGSGDDLVLMKRGQNVGYQSYVLLFPARGQGMVVMTSSDNGTALATALIRRAAAVYGWKLGQLMD
jgi:CubicO group peptidase (beta-lactamase class C family)